MGFRFRKYLTRPVPLSLPLFFLLAGVAQSALAEKTSRQTETIYYLEPGV